jgi:hypothetical protein
MQEREHAPTLPMRSDFSVPGAIHLSRPIVRGCWLLSLRRSRGEVPLQGSGGVNTDTAALPDQFGFGVLAPRTELPFWRARL